MFRSSFLLFFIFNNNIIYSLTGQGVDESSSPVANAAYSPDHHQKKDGTGNGPNDLQPYQQPSSLLVNGDEEPDARWSGDLDNRARKIQGTITLLPPVALKKSGAFFNGWKLKQTPCGDFTYDGPTGKDIKNGDAPLTITSSQLTASVPDNGNAADNCEIDADLPGVAGSSPNAPAACTGDHLLCPNDNPYSPGCSGECDENIAILPGESGEFYISSIQNQNCRNIDPADTNTEINNSGLHGYNSADSNNAGARKRVCQGETDQDRKRTAKKSVATSVTITLPVSGWVTALRNEGATVTVTGTPTTTSTLAAGDRTNTDGGATAISVTQTPTDHEAGWTLMFQPDYPEVYLPRGYYLSEGASGFTVASKYGSQADLTANTRFVAVDDWMVPNVTCTPTAMHCPIPDIWGHIDYKTPSQYPEPAEGSCTQYKFTATSGAYSSGAGSAAFSSSTPSPWECSDKTDTADGRPSAGASSTVPTGGSKTVPAATDGKYASTEATNTDLGTDSQTEDNGQTVSRDRVGNKEHNWAGNCGTSTSYFFFEKISCGSVRKFHTDRSVIEDTVDLTVEEDMIKYILQTFYTTKEPLGTGDGTPGSTPGITFINKDYHIPPVLPPAIKCTCLAAMDAYASLLAVESKTPTPGAPVTLDPEILNTGTAKIAATLRVYQDPTYSIPVAAAGSEDGAGAGVTSDVANYAQLGAQPGGYSGTTTSTTATYLPVVVSRFYLEVSTKFTRNKITISDCQAAHLGGELNSSTNALHPRTSYCDNSTFDTRTEGVPAGVTHMDRISMKKFKFQGQTTVHLQCKIRACASQPCGICATTRKLGAVDVTPVEGEIYAPPTTINVSKFDRNALTFGTPTPTTTNVISQQSAPSSVPSAKVSTMKPIEVQSAITLPVAPVWAINNKQEVAETLRKALQLTPSEVLVITSIALGRRLSQSATRSLQSASVKIDFTIGVMNANRAQVTGSKLNALASGSTVQEFTQILDATLATVGKPQLQLNPSSVVFSQPVQNVNNNAAQQTRNPANVNQGSAPALTYMIQDDTATDAVGTSQKVSKDDKSGAESSTMLIILGMVLAGAVMYVVLNKKKQASNQETANQAYASKVQYTDEDFATMTN